MATVDKWLKKNQSKALLNAYLAGAPPPAPPVGPPGTDVVGAGWGAYAGQKMANVPTAQAPAAQPTPQAAQLPTISPAAPLFKNTLEETLLQWRGWFKRGVDLLLQLNKVKPPWSGWGK